jgi:type VI secretion system VasD/TssJ family lipoprotein
VILRDGRQHALRARTLAGASLALALGLVACRKGSFTPPCEEVPRVQILLQTSDRANVGENGQSWPTKLVVYQLTGSSRLDQLDPEQLKEDAAKALGDELADKRELTAFPTTFEKLELALKPKVTHLLVVAEFQETLGTAWYTTYTVPSGVRDAQCAAAAKDEEPPLPCVYVAIEGSELVGGGMAPANFSIDEFETVCAAIGPAKKKAKPKAKPKMPDAPDLSTPKTPKTPTTPTGPKTPTAPTKPVAPNVPGR